MATLLGRHKTACLSCGFDAVHVKSNDGKHPYLYCPECGLTVPSRNGKQAAGLMAGLRAEKHQAAPQLQPGNPPQLERRPDDINVGPIASAPAPAAQPTKRATGGWGTLLDQVTK